MTDDPHADSPEGQPTPHVNAPDEALKIVKVSELSRTEGDSGQEIKLKDLTPTQKAGLQLALYVGAMIALVILGVFIEWYRHVPNLPQLVSQGQATDAAQAEATIKNYQSLYQLASEQSTRLFDLIVVKALLPVFTTILGYIFGSRAASEGT
jgi:hypothetical protein